MAEKSVAKATGKVILVYGNKTASLKGTKSKQKQSLFIQPLFLLEPQQPLYWIFLCNRNIFNLQEGVKVTQCPLKKFK